MPRLISDALCAVKAESMSRRSQLVIASTWDGRELAPAERSHVEIALTSADSGSRAIVQLTWDAPFAESAAPPAPAGYYPDLWQHEVVEVFIAGAGQEYLELEVGPYGHYALFGFARERQRDRTISLREFTFGTDMGRFCGRAAFDAAELPAGALRWNAYRITGAEPPRQYQAAVAVPGARPDFHRLERYAALAWQGTPGV